MKNSLVSFFVCILLFLCSRPGIAQTQDLKSLPNLQQAVSHGWLQFRIVAGKLLLLGSRMANFQNAGNYGSRQDRIQIKTRDGDTTLTYHWTNGKRQLNIEICNVSQVHVNYSGKAADAFTDVDFSQPMHGKCVLKLGPPDKRQIFTAPSIWHLFLAHPQQTKKYLEPLLQAINPKWQLSASLDEIESALQEKTSDSEVFESRHWATLVKQLGDESFAKRQDADRKLRAAPPAALCYLQQLDFARLDAEQLFRVQRIINYFRSQIGDDSPEQVAKYLADDASTWLALLSRDDPVVRRLAAKRLTHLLNSPIGVDPEADPSSQTKQLDQLTRRIESLEE